MNYETFQSRNLEKSEIETINKKVSEVIAEPEIKEKVDVEQKVDLVEKVDLDSFVIIMKIAETVCSKLYIAIKKDTGKKYALKVVSKLEMIDSNFIENIKTEKELLQSLDSPFIVTLDYCFQTLSHVYFFMPLISGGQLYTYLR